MFDRGTFPAPYFPAAYFPGPGLGVTPDVDTGAGRVSSFPRRRIPIVIPDLLAYVHPVPIGPVFCTTTGPVLLRPATVQSEALRLRLPAPSAQGTGFAHPADMYAHTVTLTFTADLDRMVVRFVQRPEPRPRSDEEDD